jgi:hypothetical protein
MEFESQDSIEGTKTRVADLVSSLPLLARHPESLRSVGYWGILFFEER